MNKALMFGVAMATATVLAAAWLYCWYNKDRYQFIDGTTKHYASPSVFDRNTGAVTTCF